MNTQLQPISVKDRNPRNTSTSSETSTLQGQAVETVGAEPTGVREQTPVQTVPDGGYGWVVVMCIAAINAVTWGMNTTYGVFISYYLEHQYFNGGTQLRYAFVGGLSVAFGLLSAPLANYLSKHFGFKVPMLTGLLTTVTGQCLAGISRQFGAFLVFQGLVFGSGLGLTLIPSQPLLAHWFDRRLSLAQGLANSGSGLGGLIFSNTTRVLLDTIGVKYTLVTNGGISAVVLGPAILMLRGRTKELKAKTEPLEFHWLWDPKFCWVWLWGAVAMMGYFVALYSLASYATDGVGLSQTKGAALQSILAAGQMIGRPLCGLALDKGGRLNMAIVTNLVAGLSCLAIWLQARSFGVLVVFSIIQGAVGGTVWSAAAPVAAQTVGVTHVGSALAMFWLSIVFPVTVAQPIAVALIDYSRAGLGRKGPDAYMISIGLCGGLFCLSSVVLFGGKIALQRSFKLLQKI